MGDGENEVVMECGRVTSWNKDSIMLDLCDLHGNDYERRYGYAD
jgi:hypothetical protein